MFSLLALAIVVGLTVSFYLMRRSSLKHSKTEALVFTCLYCLSLGLALRFGGRTYPGIYFSDSEFLNSLLNGNGLFVGIGYNAVLVAWIADVARILTHADDRGWGRTLRGVRWLAVGLVMMIAVYGFYFAALMQRLP